MLLSHGRIKQKMSVVLFIMMTSSLHTSAEVYKWVDENGKIHFSDKPIDQKSTAIKMKKQPSTAEIQQAKKRASALINHQRKVSEISNEDANDEKNAQLKKEKEKAKLAKANRTCDSAKREVQNLSRGYRSYILKDNGERYFLSDQEKMDMIADLNKKIAEYCID